MSDTNGTTPTFTTGETKLLMSIIRNIKNLDADWEAVAVEQGYKDASIAKIRWGQIKKNKIMPSDATASPNGSTKSTNGAGGGKGRDAGKKSAAATDGDGNDEEPTPKPKKRKTAAKAKTTVEDAEEKEDTKDGIIKEGDAGQVVKGEPED